MKNATMGWIRLGALFRLGCGCVCATLGAVAATASPLASEQPGISAGLIDLSLEALMDIQVTSVAKKPQKVSESAAAVHVITQEDIRRSGMTSIPELLRLAPGLDVAQINANKWAISARGFNDLYAYKLLVMIDGRSVYSPLFGGVSWDLQDTLLEDIERIEVVRGPGGTLWGANAVNGVINIITKQAQDTQGGLLMAAMGSRERNLEGFRYGGKLGDNGAYRIYAKQFNRTGFEDTGGGNGNDKWNQQRAGFRVDLEPQLGDTLTVRGDAHSGKSGQTMVLPMLSFPYSAALAENVRVDGSYLLADWQHVLENGSRLSLQTYYDHYNREWAIMSEKRDTYDLDLQHRFLWGGRHELVWGLDYRWTHDTTSSMASNFFTPASKTLNLFGAFLQDESLWMGDRLRVILGAKIEHNDYTGTEYQPNARLLWKTSRDGALWVAVSRAVHTPSRETAEINFTFSATPTGLPAPFPPVALARIIGNPDIKSERLLAYEIGFREKLRNNLSLDLTAYYNDYDKFIGLSTGTPFPNAPLLPSYLIVPLLHDNKAHGRAWGGEAAVNWQATERWRLTGSFSLIRMQMVAEAGSNDFLESRVAGSNPRQQWQLHSYLDLARDLNLDAAIYRVESLPSQAVPAYTRLDLRLGWRPRKDLDLSVAAQNLLDGRHAEFGNNPTLLSSEVPRGVYLKALWRF